MPMDVYELTQMLVVASSYDVYPSLHVNRSFYKFVVAS